MSSQHEVSQAMHANGRRVSKIKSPPTSLVTINTRRAIPAWTIFAIGFGLLLVAVLFDTYRFFDRQWSNLYFLIALYAAWFLRGRAELILYGTCAIATFAVPILVRPEMQLFNRITGTIVGSAIVAVIRDRRRLINYLTKANRELEDNVDARTLELRAKTSELRASQQLSEDLSRKLITLQETERSHLARELHDELGQVLTAMKMNLRRIQREPAASSDSILEENVEMIDGAIDQVRHIALRLRPPQLDQLGLVAALHWFVKQQANIAGFEGRISVIPNGLRIPVDLKIVFFRIVQEAVTNAVRHATSSHVDVELRKEGHELHLMIRDNGVGFDASNAIRSSLESGRIGLLSMRERASLAGGKLEIESKPGNGTKVHAWFPLST